MNKKTKMWLGVAAIVAIVVIIIIIFGDSPDIAAEKQRLLTEQAMAQDNVVKCPKQGTFQSDWSYCVELEMIGNTNKDTGEIIAGKRCDSFERLGIDAAIKKLKCDKCNECN